MKEKSNKKVPAVISRSKLQETLNAFNEKLKAIQVMSESPYKTNKRLPMLFEHKTIDISECTDTQFLISSLANIRMHKKSYDEVCTQILGQTSFPVFKAFGGFTYEDWENDIKLRLTVIMQEENVNKIKKAKAKLEEFLTNEDRLGIVLSEIENDGLLG